MKYQTEVVPIFRHFNHFGFYVDDLIDDSKRGRLKFEQENGKAHYTAGHGPDDVKKDMAAYVTAKVKELDDNLPERQAIVASWRKLIDQPLNLHSQ